MGPFKIDRLVNLVSYQLCLPPSMRVHPMFHVSRLRPFLCGTWPPAPCLVAGSLAYTVSCLQYLVDWEVSLDRHINSHVERSLTNQNPV
ncbi:hypothetical protein AOLI_G00297680 [Acnodon oligacanthus]